MGDIGKIKRFYDRDEIESMNVIFGKNSGNNWFSRDELSFASRIDLADFNLAEVRSDWNSNFVD